MSSVMPVPKKEAMSQLVPSGAPQPPATAQPDLSAGQVPSNNADAIDRRIKKSGGY